MDAYLLRKFPPPPGEGADETAEPEAVGTGE
jgi:hypothetical protein